MNLTRFLVMASVLALVTSVDADDPPKAKDSQRLEDFARKAVEPVIKDQKGVGVVVGVWCGEGEHAGQQVFGFGKVQLADKDVTPDGGTIFEIGSVTKAFTGTLLAEAIRRGEVKPDDPAQKYLPADWVLPRRDDRDITLLHLTTHTSGLPVQPPAFHCLHR